MKKPKPEPRAQLALAALTLIEREGAMPSSLARLAKEADLSHATTQTLLPHLAALPALIVREVDAAVAKSVAVEPEGDKTDQLFDLLMARYDFFQTHRAAFLLLAQALRENDQALRLFLRAQSESLDITLSLAGAAKAGLPHFLEKTALGLIFLYGFRVWERDETKDLSRTMAALHRMLEQKKRLHQSAKNNKFFNKITSLNTGRWKKAFSS